MSVQSLLGAAAVAAVLATSGGAMAAPAASADARKIEALQARIARLADEAVRLEDVAAIRRLQNAYGDYLDRGLWDEAAKLFADDGSIEFGNEGVYVGKAHIREYFLRLGGGREGLAKGALNSQYFIMPVITLAKDGKTAMGRWKDMAMKGEYGKAAYWGDGAYENTYVKEGGVWKIRSLHRFTTYVAPYDKGWAAASPKPDISIAAQGFPADRPPTFKYEPFPGVYIPPYHPQPYAPPTDPLLKGVTLPANAPIQPQMGAPAVPRDANYKPPAGAGGAL